MVLGRKTMVQHFATVVFSLLIALTTAERKDACNCDCLDTSTNKTDSYLLLLKNNSEGMEENDCSKNITNLKITVELLKEYNRQLTKKIQDLESQEPKESNGSQSNSEEIKYSLQRNSTHQALSSSVRPASKLPAMGTFVQTIKDSLKKAMKGPDSESDVKLGKDERQEETRLQGPPESLAGDVNYGLSGPLVSEESQNEPGSIGPQGEHTSSEPRGEPRSTEPGGEPASIETREEPGSTEPQRELGSTEPPRELGSTEPPRELGSTEPPREAGSTEPQREPGSTEPPGLTGQVGCGSPWIHSPIGNGVFTVPGEIPWIVTLYDDRKVISCKGVLLDRRTVLTTRRCFSTFNIHYLKFGQYYRWESDTRGEEIRYKFQTIIHPEYNITGTEDNDIALIKLESDLQYTQRISPVCLPTPETTAINLGKEKNGIGTTFMHFDKAILKYGIEVQSDNSCLDLAFEEYKSYELGPHMFYGRSPGVWMLDGTPLVFYDSENHRYNVEGLVLFTFGLQRTSRCFVFIKVSPYVDWIQKNMEQM